MSYNFNPQDLQVFSWSSETEGSWYLSPPNGVKVIHLPTGKVVTCEKHRSQHRNREDALQELWAWLRSEGIHGE